MHPTSLLMMVAAIAAVAAALLLPRVKPAHDRPLHWEINNKQRASSQRANGPRLRYMSFNIRYDGNERKPDNNWSARSRRVANAISTWSPAVVGMQEVLRNQLIDMVTHLAQTAHPYAAVVQNGTLGPEEVAQPSDSIRLHDTALAILFRADLLELLEQAVVRLPITPDAEKTARRIMIARFRLRTNPATVFIVFNTHLHSGSELARRNQSRGLIDTVNQWATKYPEASLVMNGDFNSLPGQFVHAALHAETPLADAWNRAEFRRGSVGISYHGWWGVVPNCLAARLVQGILFTLRGIGFDWGRWMSYPLQIVMPQFSWHSAIPEDVLLLRRLHVDWILTDRTVHVHWITVGEVRNGDFSSDHFPIIADLSFED